MKKMGTPILGILCFALLTLLAHSATAAEDILHLKSGRSVSGKFLNPTEKDPPFYKFETTDGIQFQIESVLVDSIERKARGADRNMRQNLLLLR